MFSALAEANRCWLRLAVGFVAIEMTFALALACDLVED